MSSCSDGLRVLFVTTGYPSERGPSHNVVIHRSIEALSRHLDPQVVHLRAWLPGRPLIEKRNWQGIPVLSLSCPQNHLGSASHLNTILLTMFGYMFAKSELNATNLLHATELYPAGFVARQWGRATDRPHTAHAIGSDVNVFLPSIIKRAGTEWLYSFGGIACNSVPIMARLSELVPGLRHMRVVHRGVNVNEFTPEGKVSGPQSAMPPVRFMYLGGFHTWDSRSTLYNLKGGPILLDTWRRIEDRIAPCSLYVGGPGADVPVLEKWRAGLKMPERVFLSGPVAPLDVPPLLRSCDVVVIPSLNEGLPNLANEAQACGRPVLATDVGGTAESVIHDKTGRLVRPGDVDALASGFEWFAGHPTEIAAMGVQARRHIVEDFSWKKFSGEMMAIFDAATSQ